MSDRPSSPPTVATEDTNKRFSSDKPTCVTVWGITHVLPLLVSMCVFFPICLLMPELGKAMVTAWTDPMAHWGFLGYVYYLMKFCLIFIWGAAGFGLLTGKSWARLLTLHLQNVCIILTAILFLADSIFDIYQKDLHLGPIGQIFSFLLFVISISLLFWCRSNMKRSDVVAYFDRSKTPVTPVKEDASTGDVVMNNPDREEELYAEAAAELEGGSRDEGLWAKCFAECDGDENKAKARYLKARVLRLEEGNDKAFKQPTPRSDQKVMSKLKKIGILCVAVLSLILLLFGLIKLGKSALLETTIKMAEEGDAVAQVGLGAMYEDGDGVEQNFEEAVKWYRKAAEQGHGGAQWFLGNMYEEGKGVKEDMVTAYAWHSIAVDNDDTTAKMFIDTLADEMTPEQIAKAQELAKEMVKKNPKLLK